MKYLIMTEGTCEKAFLDVLLEKGILKFRLDDLLYEEIFHARQIDESIKMKINQLPYLETVSIIRVGDKLSDELKIPRDLKSRILTTEKVCIKPEFEILYIIFDKKFENYNKEKSNNKPSEYIKYIRNDYCKTYNYNYSFFNQLANEEIVSLIDTYDLKRLGSHNDCEKSLKYLINKK